MERPNGLSLGGESRLWGPRWRGSMGGQWPRGMAMFEIAFEFLAFGHNSSGWIVFKGA